MRRLSPVLDKTGYFLNRRRNEVMGVFSEYDGRKSISHNRCWSSLNFTEKSEQLAKLPELGRCSSVEQNDGKQEKARSNPDIKNCESVDFRGRLGLDQLVLERGDLPYLASLLKRCSKSKALSDGRRLHAYISRNGYDHNTFLGNCLVDMYGNCGSMGYAQSVFDKLSKPNLYSWNILIKAYAQNGNLEDAWSLFGRMPHRDVVSWNSMIAAFAKKGQSRKALDLFTEMHWESQYVKPDKVTFIGALDACASLAALEEGQKIHSIIVDNGYEQEMVIGTALMNMYNKCGSLHNSVSVFKRISKRDVVVWNAMIAACAHNGQGMKALDLFIEMQLEGIKPNNVTFICALDACAQLEALAEGRGMYSVIVDLGYEQDVVVGTALINVFGKCRSLQDAKYIFDRLPERNVVTWNAMISAVSHCCHYKDALELFHQMQLGGIKPTKVSFINVLDACASSASLEQGKEVHTAVVDNGYEQDVAVGNTLVHMYGKCLSLCNARRVFTGMKYHDVASWNAMISALTQNGLGQEALDLVYQMQFEDVKPDNVTFVCALDACASLVSIEEGQKVYVAITVSGGCEENVVVGTALVNMYGKCGSLYDAIAVFGRMPHWNVISWNAMISASSQNGHGKEALNFFYQMQLEGTRPDKTTFVCLLDACASLAALKEGQEVYASVVSLGYEQDVVVGTSLVNMYGRCGNFDSAVDVFYRMAHRNVVCWNAMIVIYTQNGHGKEVLDIFQNMQLEGNKPDMTTFVCLLDASASLAAIEEGLEIHATIAHIGYEQDVVVGTALVNMYGKCGTLHDAKIVFDRLSSSNIVSWNAMISAFARNGQAKEVLDLFHEMQHRCIKPNEVTFICVLTACRHAGYVDVGWTFFTSMTKEYGIKQNVPHFVCMAELLGHAGHLNEAENLIKSTMLKETSTAWLSLLGACRLHGDLERGIRAANQCLKLDPKNRAPHLMLSNLCPRIDRCY